MQLFAALVPPPEILEELRSVVAAVAPTPGESAVREARPPKSHRKQASPRLSLFRRRAASALVHGHDQLDLFPVQSMNIPVTQFGNLTTSDSVRLVEELRREAATWPRPEVRFVGGAALEWPGDRGVWARISGDVEALATIGRAVPPLAQRLSLFVDRRMFRPWLQVGTITDETTAPYLEDLVAALDRFSSTTWEQQHLTLFRGKPHDEAGSEKVEELPLSGS